jgi:hypothetical protein
MNIFGITLSASDLWLLGICGTLFTLLIVYRFRLALHRYNSFHIAAITFRNKILTELEGIYPVPHCWQQNIFPKFRQSIPRIESAAAEFRFFVNRKNKFDIVVKEYTDYCEEVTWSKYVEWDMYPTMRKPGKISPRDKFDDCVKNLLLFTEKR